MPAPRKASERDIQREFGSEKDVSIITGRAPATLQKDRMFGRGFPFYRFGTRILYDLAEVRQMVRAGRVDTDRRNGSAA